MKKFKKNASIAATVLVVFGVLISFNIIAQKTDSNKLPGGGGGGGGDATRKMERCYVTSGDVITQYGNTCTSGSAGCQSNPCGE